MSGPAGRRKGVPPARERQRPSRADLIAGGPAALFAYGTLRFDEVLAVLLDRVPFRSTVAAAGWRAAALAGRVYPGLVRADAEVTGTLITGLTPAELRLIDEYEAGPYQLELLTLSDGRQGWTYAWTDQAEVLSHDWSPGEFAELHLADFAGKCRAWRHGYEAAGRTGSGIRRPHDPGPGPADRTRPKPGPLWMVISGVEHAACGDGARPQRKQGGP
jgi:gamma-glutamylcyclotransferase (GGCT)/AIG2-like uncharacterized protein YtfP